MKDSGVMMECIKRQWLMYLENMFTPDGQNFLLQLYCQIRVGYDHQNSSKNKFLFTTKRCFNNIADPVQKESGLLFPGADKESINEAINFTLKSTGVYVPELNQNGHRPLLKMALYPSDFEHSQSGIFSTVDENFFCSTVISHPRSYDKNLGALRDIRLTINRNL